MVSPVIKWLEGRFLTRIKEYLSKGLDKNQTGFVSECGTSLNCKLLIEKIRETKKSQGMCTIFIDYKSAYNTVNRSKLWTII